jgi:hypothetical protein
MKKKNISFYKSKNVIRNHTSNPSYSGGRDWEDSNLRSAPGKLERPHLNKKELAWMHASVILATQEV